MTAFIGGLIAVIIGILGISKWYALFFKALLASVPAMLILGGALAIYLGIEEMRDKRAAESFDTGADDLKQEVESLKEEVQELKTDKKDSDE